MPRVSKSFRGDVYQVVSDIHQWLATQRYNNTSILVILSDQDEHDQILNKYNIKYEGQSKLAHGLVSNKHLTLLVVGYTIGLNITLCTDNSTNVTVFCDIDASPYDS